MSEYGKDAKLLEQLRGAVFRLTNADEHDLATIVEAAVVRLEHYARNHNAVGKVS